MFTALAIAVYVIAVAMTCLIAAHALDIERGCKRVGLRPTSPWIVRIGVVLLVSVLCFFTLLLCVAVTYINQ